MVGLFGPSEEDLERLRSAVRSLGVTSVPGLSAALSWRSRKTEKLLAHELARPDTSIRYEPGRRVVRWGTVPPVPVRAPPEPRGAVSPALPARVPRAPPPVLTSTGLRTLCPHCHVPLLATGATNLAVCPQCGRLANARSATAGDASPEPVAPSPPPTGGGEPTPPLSLGDRRAQEMFAAYVTSRPIPCPKCRTPLKHRSVSEYACPSCGQLVRFPSTGGPILLSPSPPARTPRGAAEPVPP